MNFELKPLNLVALANEKADLLILLVAQDFKPGKDELSILVAQTVKQGQKIAEMGSSDTDRVKLHFEIRRQGKPVDPVKLLPGR